MSSAALETAAAALIALTALLALLTRSRRLNIGLLGLQYLGLFALISRTWQLPQAAAILFAGWMSAAVLGMAALSAGRAPEESAGSREPGLWLKLAAAGLTLILAVAASDLPRLWIPAINPWTSAAALILTGLSLLRLTLYPDAFQSALALLGLLGGFSLLFAHLSASQTAAALLAATTILLALAGAYLIVAPAMEESA